MFKEPDDPSQIKLAASIFIIPTVIFIVLMFTLKSLIVGGMPFVRIFHSYWYMPR